MNKLKERIYNLTEKQVEKIIGISGFIIFIIISTCVAIIAIKLSSMQIKFVVTFESIFSCVFVFFLANFFFIGGFGAFLWTFLWENPYKQEYLWNKEHDEIIMPKVREKFGLNPEFKEVLYNPVTKNEKFKYYQILGLKGVVKFFAKEVENVILVSIRSKDGTELMLKEISNYKYFDSHYKLKI